MTMYSEAVSAVRVVVDRTQTDLDATAAKARSDNLTAQRAAILAWEDPDSPYRAVVELVAHSLTIGRYDGYPRFNLPEDTQNVVKAAIRSGMDCHGMHEDGSGFATQPDPAALDADYVAWDAARAYRTRQTVYRTRQTVSEL